MPGLGTTKDENQQQRNDKYDQAVWCQNSGSGALPAMASRRQAIGAGLADSMADLPTGETKKASRRCRRNASVHRGNRGV